MQFREKKWKEITKCKKTIKTWMVFATEWMEKEKSKLLKSQQKFLFFYESPNDKETRKIWKEYVCKCMLCSVYFVWVQKNRNVKKQKATLVNWNTHRNGITNMSVMQCKQ